MALIAGGVAVSAFAKDNADNRPNIVLMLADDWGFPHARSYGATGVDSRALDRIAAEGMLFTRAYSAAPHSSPSRASILTGQHPHRLKDGCNLNCYFPADLTVYPDVLEEAGYDTVYWGKGWGPGVWNQTGWEHNPAGREVKDIVKYIEQDAPADKPICVWMGSRRPHRPYKQGSGEAHGFNPDSVTLIPYLPDAPDVRTDVADYYYNIQLFQDECEEVMEALRKTGRLDNTLLIITGDNGDSFPRAKSNLYDLGCHVPFAVRWPGVIKPGSVCDGFVSLMDLTATFYEAAGVKPKEKMDSRSLIPVFKGDYTACRKEIYSDRERHTNTRPGGYGYPMRSVQDKDFLYIRNLYPDRLPAGTDPVYGDTGHGPAKAFMVFQRDKYPKEIFDRAFGLRPAEELYDLRKDPGCLNNVADSVSYAKTKKKMSRRLTSWMKRTSDPRVDPGNLCFDTLPYVRKAMRIALIETEGCLKDSHGKDIDWVRAQIEKLRKQGVKVIELRAAGDLTEYVAVLNNIKDQNALTGREITLLSGTETGILAAKEAGIIPAGVTWGGTDAKTMVMSGASYVLTNQEELELCLDFL